MIRRLTEGERALARSVFAETVALDAVRLLAFPFDRAFVPGRIGGRSWIAWPARSLPRDISTAPLNAQATLIHELVHVWQSQSGINLLTAKLKAGDGPAAYAYVADTLCRWDGLNIEQQAMVVEHGFRRSRGQGTPGDAAFYDRVCPFRIASETQRFDPRA